MQRRSPALVCALALLCGRLATLEGREPVTKPRGHLEAPAGSRPAKIDPAGETVLPNGRLITPSGKQVEVAPHPYGLALSPDGSLLVTVNGGTAPLSFSIISRLDRRVPRVEQVPPGVKSADADPESVFLGAAISPNQSLYLSEGNNGRVGIFDLETHRRLSSISLDGGFRGKTYAHSLPGEMRLAPDGRRLYVLDLAHFRLVTLDAQSQQILSSFPVGRLPFGLALSPDGRRAYVSNVGMFRYSLVPNYDPKKMKETGLEFPPFGFPSKEAEAGVTVNGEKISGLGDPNTPDSNSLWVIDVVDPADPRVVTKINTGVPVGKESVGGSSPGAVVAGRKKIFVSNATQDSVSIINATTLAVEKTVLLEPSEWVRGLRGVLPFGMALSRSETRLYVACAGINAVAVLDGEKGVVLGYIPTGWFPVRAALSNDSETLFVANAKGFGAGPNGGPGFRPGPEGIYIGDITKGTVSIIKIPQVIGSHPHRGESGASRRVERLNARVLTLHTQRVLRNNGFIPPSNRPEPSPDFPIPPPGQASRKIHHVVYIVKENRTFDQVFGDLAEVGGERTESDPNLTEFGEDAEVRSDPKDKDRQQAVAHARVTPNHHALARRFGISDNYFVDSDVSVDGHHWLQGNYPNELLESSWPTSYGGKLDFIPDADAPGRLTLSGAAPRPETYLQAGSLWTHLANHHITFRNYGEGLDVPGSEDGPGLEPTGLRQSTNVPLPEPLFENTSRSYPTFNTSISDQYRFQQFQNEFRVRYLSGKEAMPAFMCLWLPNDHTDTVRPAEGYPYRASFVADNDLALGKLVELFSHSPYWNDMAIFVTEDDAQDGQDHVDAHRSLLMVIGPYARRGVSHVHTSMASILKTFDLILGLPYLNQYDAAATDLSDSFTDKPDFSPYQALPPDTRVFDPAKVVEPALELRAQPRSAPLDDPATIRRELRERLKRKDDD